MDARKIIAKAVRSECRKDYEVKTIAVQEVLLGSGAIPQSRIAAHYRIPRATLHELVLRVKGRLRHELR